MTILQTYNLYSVNISPSASQEQCVRYRKMYFLPGISIETLILLESIPCGDNMCAKTYLRTTCSQIPGTTLEMIEILQNSSSEKNKLRKLLTVKYLLFINRMRGPYREILSSRF